MQSEVYKYLFPYEKVRPGSKIVIYGAGILGREYLKQIQITKYCQIVAFIDKNAEKIAPFGAPLYKPEQIAALTFDHVVVALRNDHFLREIKRILHYQGIADEAIICVCERNISEMEALPCEEKEKNKDLSGHFAYMDKESSNVPIALYMVGGVGDAIIKKRLVEELARLLPNCLLDIYCCNDLSWLYSDFQQLNELVQDNGVLYHAQYHKYVLALTLKAYFIEVDSFLPSQVQELPESFIQKIKKLEAMTLDPMTNVSKFPKYIVFMRNVYKGNNCYTSFSYEEIFDIKDSKVHIPLRKDFAESFRSLGLYRYITVNFGNGDSEDMHLVAKAWPISYFEKTVAIFKEKYPNIQVVQLGTKSAEKIQGADQYILGESFELVKYVLKHSIFHLDIEGGLVHLATQLGTKCIVLFGPTNVLYVGYPQNINIKAGKCHNCYGLYSDLGRCARNLHEPECMYSITPEIVIESIEEYMEKAVKKDYVRYRVHIDKLGLREPLICELKDNTDIITDIEIVQDKENFGVFEFKVYLNPIARIQSADDPRLSFACENLLGNISLCTKAHVGSLEYIESDILGRKSCCTDIVCKMTVPSSEAIIKEIKDCLSKNQGMSEWEMLYRMAMLPQDDVTKYMLLYAILSSALETIQGKKRITQKCVDSFIRKKCSENKKTEYLGKDVEEKTIYTLLRNSIGHAKVETNLSEAYNQITNKVTELAEITLWAIREIDNGLDND